MAQPGFYNLPPAAQQAAIDKAENRVMMTQRDTGIDADSRITEAIDAEASTLARIEQEENQQKLRDLPCPSQPVSYFGPCKNHTNFMKDHIYEQ
jgi:hypothetical protein